MKDFIVPESQEGFPFILRSYERSYNDTFILESSNQPIIREFGKRFLDMLFPDLENLDYPNLIDFFSVLLL